MQRAEVDRQRRETCTVVQRTRRPGGVDAVRHRAVLGQPVGGVVGDDVHVDAASHAAMRVVARTHLGHRPRSREGEDAPLLAGMFVVPESHVLPLCPSTKL